MQLKRSRLDLPYDQFARTCLYHTFDDVSSSLQHLAGNLHTRVELVKTHQCPVSPQSARTRMISVEMKWLRGVDTIQAECDLALMVLCITDDKVFRIGEALEAIVHFVAQHVVNVKEQCCGEDKRQSYFFCLQHGS